MVTIAAGSGSNMRCTHCTKYRDYGPPPVTASIRTVPHHGHVRSYGVAILHVDFTVIGTIIQYYSTYIYIKFFLLNCAVSVRFSASRSAPSSTWPHISPPTIGFMSGSCAVSPSDRRHQQACVSPPWTYYFCQQPGKSPPHRTNTTGTHSAAIKMRRRVHRNRAESKTTFPPNAQTAGRTTIILCTLPDNDYFESEYNRIVG